MSIIKRITSAGLSLAMAATIIPKFVCRQHEVCKHAVLGDGKIS